VLLPKSATTWPLTVTELATLPRAPGMSPGAAVGSCLLLGKNRRPQVSWAVTCPVADYEQKRPGENGVSQIHALLFRCRVCVAIRRLKRG